MLHAHTVVTHKQSIPASCQRTNDFEIARLRLSKFVREEALRICRNTGLNYEESDTAPATYEGLRLEFYNALTLGKTVRVFKGESENTIYDYPATNWAFRFWHDTLHFANKLDFSYDDELMVGRMQTAKIASEFGLGSLEQQLMEIDTIWQVEHYESTGDFVGNQLEFAKAHLGII